MASLIFFSLKWSPQEMFFDILTLRYWLMPFFPKYECKKQSCQNLTCHGFSFNINTKFHMILWQLRERQLILDLANIQVCDHLCLSQVYNIQHNQKFGQMLIKVGKILQCSKKQIIPLQLWVGLQAVFVNVDQNVFVRICCCTKLIQWIHTKMYQEILKRYLILPQLYTMYSRLYLL